MINIIDSFFLSFKEKLQYLNLDLRSISLFRIVLGISLLYNLILVRWIYAVELLGNDRIIPFKVMQELNGSNSFSIFDVIHNNSFSKIYLLIVIVSTILYTIGFKTKYFSLLTLFLYWNMLQATYAFGFAYDFFTFQLLFWSCFLPLDNYFSISENKQLIKPRFSVSLVLIFQIVCVYFFTGVAKYGISWQNGYAIHNMLMDNWSTRMLAKFLVDTPSFYTPLTYGTRILELLFPLLIFIPTPKFIFRYIAIAFLIGFHLSIFILFDVANFSITGFAAAIILLPTHFWNIFSIKNIKTIKLSNTKWISRSLIIFCAFSIYVISVKNLIFSTKNSTFKNEEMNKNVTSFLNTIDVPSPIKTSFFLQNWKMFAPNPPAKLGWLALEIKKEDGFYYDLATNQLITDFPTINWQPSGYERYIMAYARTFVYTSKGDRFKIFLKYWIPYKINKLDSTANKKDIIFADYLFLVQDQSKPFKPPLQKIVYPLDSITNYRPFNKY